MLVSDYNYDLPEDRIAKFPPKERGTTRLLVLDRKTGKTSDSYYRNLDDFLNPGDVLILNDTRVMQSRLFCELPDGRKRELVVLEKHGDEPQRVMYRGKLRDGDELKVSDCLITIKKILGNGIAEVESNIPLADLTEIAGTVPLPPYLHRDATEADKKRYQTVWAKNMGSAAAPTASLNMTEDLLDRLRKKGVIIKYLTLHVGLGTFLPIRSDKIEDHKMHSEWFNIPEDTIEAITKAKLQSAGSRNVSFEGPKTWPSGPERPEKETFGQAPRPRIVALGTTVARTLEYYAKTGKTSGEDDIFIYPGFEFQIVDALITNFHAPKSTVLMLASAFAGWDNLKNAYKHAIDEKYNFLSYGDSMLIC
ncbi:S-adenosylmethionine:tRNA ribosyltransferase-isomerase [Candidatus Saccharibacteria bacterium]|nr:S-adenosylmethionine:tRNA ribosyltransferase-isomerase [Candidatus Saccharibacteria bacterium]